MVRTGWRKKSDKRIFDPPPAVFNYQRQDRKSSFPLLFPQEAMLWGTLVDIISSYNFHGSDTNRIGSYVFQQCKIYITKFIGSNPDYSINPLCWTIGGSWCLVHCYSKDFIRFLTGRCWWDSSISLLTGKSTPWNVVDNSDVYCISL
jgi:hypothetical protein